MKTLQLTAAIAIAISSTAFAQEGIRDKIRELENKAGAAQTEGRPEEAEKLRNEARELAARAKAENEKRDGEKREKPGREELQSMLEKSRQQLEAAARDGKQDETAEIKQRIARLESALRESGGDGRRAEKRGQQPDRPELAEPMRRLQHLHQAIEHLRAAGMNEPANSLAEQAQEMKRQIAGATEGKRPDGEKHPKAERQISELREGMMSLHRQMQEMQKRLEELSRERR